MTGNKVEIAEDACRGGLHALPRAGINPTRGEGKGEGEKVTSSSPPPSPAFGGFILPHQGGGDTRDARRLAAGRFTIKLFNSYKDI
jgi:hypothetical protein